MSSQPSKHDIDSLMGALHSKGLSSYVVVVDIEEQLSRVKVKDLVYGIYSVDLKSFAPKSKFPLHKRRRHQFRLEKTNREYVGKEINGLTIKCVFYGPDRGYKNRSFYCEFSCICGFEGISTHLALKSKKLAKCHSCNADGHKERIRIEGVLKKRTATYSFWANNNKKKNFPHEYQDFKNFIRDAGEKPPGRAEVDFVDGKPHWRSLSAVTTDDKELQLIANAMRQAFRYSTFYKEALERSKVEGESTTLYRCDECAELFKFDHIQVDHIEPVAPLDGSPLHRNTLIDRIWTNKIQVLDKKCHSKKSKRENALRKKAKEEMSKKNGKYTY